MSSSAKEDQEQGINADMEDSDAMTVEFLRARLLSERSISKTARQRADELAKRVAELEEQLKFVSLQRKKAEKATTDVLAILENCGISDVSEGFGSCSDEDGTPHEVQACNGSVTIRESSTDAKVNKSEVEAYSSSEFESSQSTRSLSWKSAKKSEYYLENKKYVDSVRRKASVASNSSSARRVGKSCRKVRRRETRSPEELQNDGLEQVTCGTDVSNCSDGKHYDLRESIGYENEKKSIQLLSSNSETQKNNGRYSSNEDMESALQHQVQLIGQYEAEEKAQREWEDKFRENNTGQQDSWDLGDHSDVTEEPCDVKSPELSCGATALDLNNQETKQEPVHACENLQDKNLSGTISCEQSASAFSFPMSKVELPIKHQEASSSSSDLVISSQKTSDDLVTVLEQLHRAKLSLNQKLPSEVSKPEIDRFKVPEASPGIFRLPIDYQHRATMTTSRPIIDGRFGFTNSHAIGAQSSFANLTPEIANGRFLSGGYVDSRGEYSGERFLTTPSRTVISTGMYPSQPRLDVGSTSYGKTNQFDDGTSYPYFQNTMRRAPLNKGVSRSFSTSETGLPPIIRSPLYDDVVRRNMHI